MDWYTWRIIHLVDEVNRLTDLLSNCREQAAADHARDALIEDADRLSLVEFGLSQHPEV